MRTLIRYTEHMIAYNLKGTGAVMLTDEVRDYLNNKLEKIEKLVDPNDTAVRADVELATTGGARTGELFRAEINLSISGAFFRAEASEGTLHAAIDEAVDELRRELQKKIGKKRDLGRRAAQKVKDLYRYWKGS